MQFSPSDAPERSILELQNLEIWELLQPEEEKMDNGDDLFPILENGRWITVEQEDAGEEDEKVLFRTFVNAEIGSKRFRRRTRGAPYLLLLSTKKGESEPKITICNQSSTLCLQRDFVPADLNELIRVSNLTLTAMPGTRVFEPVSFKFDRISVSVSFQYAADLGQFINIPSAYFQAVRHREPVDCSQFSETIVFKSGIESFEQLKTPNMTPFNSPVLYDSCEVRILERSFGETWRSTRRMVISTSAAEKYPGCVQFFMPMSRVQIKREESSREVLIKWSDTTQERSNKTDGNYNPLFSYVYDGNSPNIGLSLHFRTETSVAEFEKAVLSLSVKPIFAWAQTNSSGHIYDIVDPGLNQKHYKAVLLLLQSNLSWKYSEIYYLYRDVDYIYEHLSLRVRFPQIYFTDYVSNHVDKLYRADRPVTFSHCEKKIGHMVADFNDEPVLRGFMTSIAPSYELLYSRRAQWLMMKNKSIFGFVKLPKGNAEVQLWRKGNAFQLASRWLDNNVTDKWLTMSVSSGVVNPGKDSNRVVFSRVQYFRGSVLDMANLVARNTKVPGKAVREGVITIAFETVKDREEFVGVLEGKPVFLA